MCGSRMCVGATGKGRGFVCGGSAWVGAWFDRYRWGMVTTILMGPIGQCALLFSRARISYFNKHIFSFSGYQTSSSCDWGQLR